MASNKAPKNPVDRKLPAMSRNNIAAYEEVILEVVGVAEEASKKAEVASEKANGFMTSLRSFRAAQTQRKLFKKEIREKRGDRTQFSISTATHDVLQTLDGYDDSGN
jgi:hypothetical protein